MVDEIVYLLMDDDLPFIQDNNLEMGNRRQETKVIYSICNQNEMESIARLQNEVNA